MNRRRGVVGTAMSAAIIAGSFVLAGGAGAQVADTLQVSDSTPFVGQSVVLSNDADSPCAEGLIWVNVNDSDGASVFSVTPFWVDAPGDWSQTIPGSTFSEPGAYAAYASCDANGKTFRFEYQDIFVTARATTTTEAPTTTTEAPATTVAPTTTEAPATTTTAAPAEVLPETVTRAPAAVATPAAASEVTYTG